MKAANTASQSLDQFLAGIERKAFRMAQIALRNEADALDAVQDAMLQLVRSYAARPASEWRPLFYRILTNRIRDLQRRRSVRSRVMAWLPFAGGESEDEAWDPIANAPAVEPGPEQQLALDQSMALLEQGLAALPARQREAFMLRTFEGLDVVQTALAMRCSQGSVKTHHFRAVQALRTRLGEP
ncbi:MAG: RNA polymerase sigma factor [Steroidobacteraceae bacterium]